MGIFERHKLSDTADVEQTLATGETSDGDKPKNVVSDMVPLLDDPAVRYYVLLMQLATL
jgi:syntaxin-binding protein 1